MDIDYVFLCGVMWAQYESVDAGLELLRALRSDDPKVVSLASALLERTKIGRHRESLRCGRTA